jgi:hypothetical protein
MDLTEGEDGAAVGSCRSNSQYEAIVASVSGSVSVSGSIVLGLVDTDTDTDADGFIFIFGYLELMILSAAPLTGLRGIPMM